MSKHRKILMGFTSSEWHRIAKALASHAFTEWNCADNRCVKEISLADEISRRIAMDSPVQESLR